MKERITKRINLGNGKYTIDFSNEKAGKFLTDHKAGVRALFKRLAMYEDMQEALERKIEDLKASSEYPHNFTGQMVEDFEWVLKMLMEDGGEK